MNALAKWSCSLLPQSPAVRSLSRSNLIQRLDVHYTRTHSIGRVLSRARSFSRSCSGSSTTAGQSIVNKKPNETVPLPLASSSSSAIVPIWLVQNPYTVATVPIIGNLAYFSLAGGFLCTDLLSLRLLLCCGYTGLVTYHAIRPKPLLIPLRWSAFFVAVNASMAVMLILDRMPPTLTEEEEELYLSNFAPLTRKQFKALIDKGKRITYTDQTLLTRANEPCRNLYFILSGATVMTNADGKHTSRLQRGGFPNCMSFQRTRWDMSERRKSTENQNAYGSITCDGEVECIVWDDEELLSLLAASSPKDDMRLRMDHVVIESVIRRLLYDTGGADVKEYIKVISQGWADKEVQHLKLQSTETSATTVPPRLKMV